MAVNATHLLTALGLVALVSVGAPLAAYTFPSTVGADEALVVLTGSMQPTIDPGDVVFIEQVAIEDVEVGDIDSDEALFGAGLGLDSIDALELGLALQKQYGIKLDSDSEETRKHFASIQALARLVAGHQSKE